MFSTPCERTGVFFLLAASGYNEYMEFAIGVGIGVTIALIAGKRKKRNTQHKGSLNADVERQRRQKADEELITVILPTIDNDK